MHKQLDICFVNTNSQDVLYQDLATRFTAIEPPTWSLLLAEACRSVGYSVSILDCIAENLSYQQTVDRIRAINPRLVCFVSYGNNPNSSTCYTFGVFKVAELLKQQYPEYFTLSIGSHTSALPREVLSSPYIDFVCINEGVRATKQLLGTDLKTDLQKINGLGYKEDDKVVINSGKDSIVPQELMDIEMPGYAWDLLPYKSNPLDMYRSHNWLPGFIESKRSPYAALQTAIGCVKSCSFCMINIVNRVDETEGIHAANSNIMRHWSNEWVCNQFDRLVEMGVTTIRISDELYFINRRYYEPQLNHLISKGYGKDLCMWTYSRIDTVKPKFLDLFREAGVKFLGIGIESASQEVRREITKGNFEEVNIRKINQEMIDAGINRGFNYIFGLPPEDMKDMQSTLDLALELNSEFANFYHSLPLPGSPLYYEAEDNGWEKPSSLSEYSFHSYDAKPVPTKHLTSAEVLKFRDDAWHKYFERPEYQALIASKFGQEASDNIKEQTKIRLKRKILGD